MKIVYLSIILSQVFLCSCGAFNPVTIVDKDMNPHHSRNQLELAQDRGEVAHVYYGSSDEALLTYRNSGSGSKSWLLHNWGKPDHSYREKGIEYLIYNRRSKNAANYSMRFIGGEDPVKLGYQNNKLIYVEAYFKNCPDYMTRPVYVLPR